MHLLLVHVLLFATTPLQTALTVALRSKFTNVSYEHNTDYFTRMKSWLTTEGYLNADVYVDRSLPPTMRTSITVQFQIENSRNYHTLFNYDVDTCQSVKSHTAGSLPSLWFRNVRKYGNLSAICPMKAGYYDLRNFHVEDKSIPVYLRPGNYRIQDTNYYGKNNAKARQRRLVSTIILQMQLY
ncbi:uncharacterized protein Dmoj_GI21274 [Drosophila mojavensis]|uniref:Uncharacterized protein n=1 Tax=Drosophila mojavensis TaxID=7230 RepID=B4KUG8_DROMO|nr:uncharacterized protein Dmoj_GI21274 [Drosophila mojavensis]